MPGPSLGVGEEVLITVYAVHKKCPGTVWFTTRRALWRAADGKAVVQRVEVPWAAVMSFQVGCAGGYSSICVGSVSVRFAFAQQLCDRLFAH